MEMSQTIIDKYQFIKCSIDCENGWLKLLDRLFFKIEELLIKNKQNNNIIDIVQIKEKFGTLRVYFKLYTCPINHKDVYRLIDSYETASALICEYCGQPGVLRYQLSYKKTLCDKCFINEQINEQTTGI